MNAAEPFAKIRTSGGFTGLTQTWALYPDGTVSITMGTDDAAPARTQKTPDGAAGAERLRAALRDSSVLDLAPGRYGTLPRGAADVPETTLEILNDGRWRTYVIVYHRDLPPALQQARELIREYLDRAG